MMDRSAATTSKTSHLLVKDGLLSLGLDAADWPLEYSTCDAVFSLDQIRPYADCLVQYLPLLWKQSVDHNMLRCAILTTLIHLVQVWHRTTTHAHSHTHTHTCMHTDYTHTHTQTTHTHTHIAESLAIRFRVIKTQF